MFEPKIISLREKIASFAFLGIKKFRYRQVSFITINKSSNACSTRGLTNWCKISINILKIPMLLSYRTSKWIERYKLPRDVISPLNPLKVFYLKICEQFRCKNLNLDNNLKLRLKHFNLRSLMNSNRTSTYTMKWELFW